MPGRFIVLEGGEGCGKTTQLQLLEAAFKRAGLAVAVTREPGGTPLAEAVRTLLFKQPTGEARDPATEALLLAAARHDHVGRVIRPVLAAGTHVLCDRFSASTQVYQGALNGASAAWLAQVEALAIGPFKPCLNILLDIGAEEAEARMQKRGEQDWFDGESRQTHLRIFEAYRALAAEAPHEWLVVDASGSPEQVHALIRAAFGERLGLAI